MITYNNYRRLTSLIGSLGLLVACADEQPIRTVTEFIENPMILEAVMVRCSEDRTKTRYDAECINARQAVKLIEAKQEAAQRADLEARSEDKRQALRRGQEAVAEAQRRSAETERLRKEAEYLAQFGVALPPEASLPVDETATDGNSPIAVIPNSVEPASRSASGPNVAPATDGGNAPAISKSDAVEGTPDIEAVREELRRRNEADGD